MIDARKIHFVAFQYLVKVLRVAFSHSLSRAQDTIFVLLILGGIVTFFVPALHMSIDVSGWQIAAVVLGGIVALRLLLAPYWIYRADQQTIRDLIKRQVKSSGASTSHTTLSVALYHTDRDLTRTHRIGVRNDGSVVATNVKVSLINILPRPSESEMFRNDFPYRVVKANAVWSVHSTIAYEDVHINPHEEERFRVAVSYPWQDGFLIKDLDTNKHGDSYGLYTAQGKEWLLMYEITSGNAPPINLSFTAIANSQGLIISRKS